MWTNVFFLDTIPKHICCCVKVQLKVVCKDGVLRYTAWTKKSGWDTKKKIKRTEVAEVLAQVTCLGSSHPIILSPYPKRIQNWNSFHTVFSRWGANCNIGSLFFVLIQVKEIMLNVNHYTSWIFFQNLWKQKSDLPCLQASLRYCCKRLKAVDIWHPTNSDLHGRRSTGNSQKTASCFLGGLKVFGVDNKPLILTSNNMLLVPPIWPISNPHLRAMIQPRIVEQVM